MFALSMRSYEPWPVPWRKYERQEVQTQLDVGIGEPASDRSPPNQLTRNDSTLGWVMPARRYSAILARTLLAFEGYKIALSWCAEFRIERTN